MNAPQKKLPIGEAPINYLMRFYIPLMITFLVPEEVKGWFYSSYIMTKVRKKSHKFWMVFQNFNPFVVRTPIPFLSSSLINKNNFKKTIKKLIDHNWYISVTVDFYYINGSFCYNKKHFFHSVLLYGYDFKNEKLNLCGYCFSSKIQCIDVNINEFIDSFFSCNHNKAWIYKRRRRKRTIKFNKRFFFLGVKGYVTATCPIEYQCRARSFSAIFREHYGIAAHIQLKEDLFSVLNGEEKDLKLRIYSYWELTKCMIKRLEYMDEKNILFNTDKLKHDFKRLLNKYDSMLNMFIKYEITKDKTIIESLINIHEELCDNERYLYNALYNLMKQQFNYK